MLYCLGASLRKGREKERKKERKKEREREREVESPKQLYVLAKFW